MRDVKSASAFLSPDIKDLHDPMTLLGMARAAERLATAVIEGERIALYGDYDVDGTTSVALMTLFFNALGVEPLCRIPDRVSEGYGLNIAAIESLAEQGVGVIITADCGSTNHEEVARGASLGIDVIITDHHELPDGPPPEAYATINPKQQECDFPFKGLSGVGVAFNLVIALRARLRELGYFTGGVRTEPNLSQYLDLVAVGTVADMVPLVDENRILVHLGLKVLSRAKRPGLKALMESAGVEPSAVDSGAIGFKIGPRINAAGRVASATIAYRLLVTDDAREAKVLAERLETENNARRELEARILDEAIEEVERTGANKNRAMALSSDRWHPGIIGIVASRLVERYSRPVVMIAVEGGVGKGSVRSVKSVDVVNALGVCRELLTRFGGHRAAAGLTLESGRIEEFKTAFVSHFNSTLTDDDLVGELNLDAGVELSTIDVGFATELGRLAPFGMGNKEPLLYIEGLTIKRTEILKSKHLRLQLSQNGYERKAIAFNMAALHPLEGDGYTIAFSTGLNEWRGRVSADIKIKGVRRAD
jgi:single-stranded-DNA-specific exonuclease